MWLSYGKQIKEKRGWGKMANRTKRTTHWRVDKNLAANLKMRFPEMSEREIFNFTYHSSLIKIESVLRKNVSKKTNKR